MKNIERQILIYELSSGLTIWGTPLTKQQLKQIKQKLEKERGEQQVEYGC